MNNFLPTSKTSTYLKVMIRIRPPLPRELYPNLPFRSIVQVSPSLTSLSLIEYLGTSMDEKERQNEFLLNPSLFQYHAFTFDYSFDISSTQEDVYEKTAHQSVNSVLEGYNSTIFAYGQTGTGKTHTMEGFTYSPNDSERGLVPRAVEEIFNNIENFSNSNTKFIIRASYLQLYNENISDLLKPERKNLPIREDKKKGIYVEGLSDWVVRSSNDIYSLLEQGASNRVTSSTFMNDVSSRSHAIFIITVEQLTSIDENYSLTKIGKLNLVDLAGSERIKITGAKGKQLEESKRINKSLSALGNVINALTDLKKNFHIPYRDSKLTRLLEDSLGGNCKTIMITTISPCHDFFNENLSSLLFAKRAKKIKNKPIINQDFNHKSLISQYEIQLKFLKEELEEKNKMLNNNKLLIELEKAENDKKEVLKQLEETSSKYLMEREEKNKLEMKIALMNSQMIIGGEKKNLIEDTPEFRIALEERQNILLKEFDNKFQEFENERLKLENDNIEVERYKNLLIKQRDIMITLTSKLNERDESIVQLQEENEGYEKINCQQEELIEKMENYIIKLKNLIKENNFLLPENLIKEEQSFKNNNSLNGSLSKSQNINRKKYLPYEMEKNHFSNKIEFDNSPLIMLNADEKIKELKQILKEQENQINILKLVSQKFISSSCENKNGIINIDSIIKSLSNGIELHNKIREIENEKNYLINELEKQNELLNSIKTENENLNEQNSELEKINEKNEKEIFDLVKNVNKSNNLLKEIAKNNPSIKNEIYTIISILHSKNFIQNYNENSKIITSSNNINSGRSSSSDIFSINNSSSDYDFKSKNKNILYFNKIINKNTGSYAKNAKMMHKKKNNISYNNNNEEFISKFINVGK